MTAPARPTAAMTSDRAEWAAYVALIDAAQALLHQAQRAALERFRRPDERLHLQAALLDAHRVYQRQIGLR